MNPERIVVNGRELTCFDFPPEAAEYTVSVDADGDVKCRNLDGSYLLEHFRKCGQFKCTECIYSKHEDTHLGKLFKCVHPGTLVHQAMKDEADIMRSCACFWFEPTAKAGEYVARRAARQMDAWRLLIDYAERHTQWTATGDSADERTLRKIKDDLRNLGVIGL